MAKKQTTSSVKGEEIYKNYPKSGLSFSVNKKGSFFNIQLFFSLPEDKQGGRKKGAGPVPALGFFKAGAGEKAKSADQWYVGLGDKKSLTTEQLGSTLLSVFNDASENLSSVKIKFPADLFDLIEPEVVSRLLVVAAGTATFPVELLKATYDPSKSILREVDMEVPSKFEKNALAALQSEMKTINHLNGHRQVQALPANYMNPEIFEKRARQMATKFGFKITVFNRQQLEKMGAEGIISVGKGSVIPPRMIIMEYNTTAKKSPLLALVGKGVTFDSGGISIKPSSDMHEMKYDMSGAGAVLHSIASIADQKIPLRVVAAVGLAENMPDGAAIKPGDVYRSYSGHTIEVQNTDAEGRLILGDLLSYVDQKYKPDYMIDLATLTGACMVALGNYYAGLFSQNGEIAELIEQASKNSLEPVWRLPMGELYKAQLKSNIADYNNIGDRWGGASSAASFLSVFVSEDTKWAHLDIAGIADLKKGFGVYQAVGTGYGVRLLTELAKNLAGKKGTGK